MAELLIDHRFLDKTLLQEALTHPSCERDTLTESYQRLEFLGDAVLDMIVVTAIFEENPNCSHGSMSQIKAALVNADLLAFLCLEVSMMQDAVHIQQKGERTFCEVHEEEKIELWKYMRRHGREITEAQQACVKRHQQLRREIELCLKYDRLYPWALLAQLDAEKFFSDIIESVFGAIFVDTRGTLADCQRFVERIGVMPYLRRIMADGIDIVHPKASLERLTGPDKIEYIVGFEESDNHVHQCSIRINNIDVVTVGGCLTKDEAVMRAADSAAKLISGAKPQATRTPSQHM
jgi:dsRNA-specific ribonuclease